jgi:hypothetical protein
MSHPGLDADLAAALELLQRELGPLQVLDVHPTPPPGRLDVSSAPAGTGPTHPSLFDPPELEPAPSPSTTEPLSHIPPSRRWREVLHADDGRPAPPPPTHRRTA